MNVRSLFLSLLPFSVVACSGPGGGTAGNDANSGITCRSDRECSATNQVCERTQGVCVQCLSAADCLGANQLCERNQCVVRTPCMSSRQCPGRVCSMALGYCVDCNADVDCAEGQMCAENQCIVRPPSCTSSRQCSDRGQVCEPTRMVCVDCVGDNDCSAGEVCSAANRCVRGTVTMDANGPDEAVAPDVPMMQPETGPVCTAPNALCSGVCVNLSSSNANCGSCGRACPTGAACVSGSCMAGANPCSIAAAEGSYTGCEFYATVSANSQLANEFTFGVLLANPGDSPAQVTITGGALSTPVMRSVSAGGMDTVSLPWVQSLGQRMAAGATTATPATSAMAAGGAYRIVSTAPVAAYQFNPLGYRMGTEFSYTNDTSLLLPVTSWGRDYRIGTRSGWQSRSSDPFNPTMGPALGGFLSIVAYQPGTRVDVNLTAPIVAGTGVAAMGTGLASYTLGAGDVLQLLSTSTTADLSGSTVSSTAAVAVFAGHDCSNVPSDRPACDHLEEQMLPVRALGRTYVVSQTRDRALTLAYRVKVIATAANTTLAFDGIPTPTACNRTFGAGEHCEFEATSHFTMSATAPVLVLQFMLGQGPNVADCMNAMPADPLACRGDPSMLTEVPIERYRNSYDVAVPTEFPYNFANIVARSTATITIDGVPATGTSVAAGATYRVFTVPLTSGRHRIVASPSSERIGVKLYGSAQYTSYGHPAGLSL